MPYSYPESVKRINAHLADLDNIEVVPLTREINLDNLSEKKCRRIYGAHIYTFPSGFVDLASMPLDKEGDAEKYKRTIQATHLYQREVSRIVEKADICDATRIHFQGVKLHALIYHPIENAEKIAAHAVLMQWVLEDFVRQVFNPAYEKLDDVALMGGADIGHAIGTRNGEKTDRELLFLGSPANHAAKILEAETLRIATRLYDKLPEDLQEWCVSDEDGNYHLLIPDQSELDEILDDYGVKWDREASRKRLDDDKKQFPLCDIEYSDANAKIIFDRLGITNNKRANAVSFFADVTNFTAYIDAAENLEDQQSALRLFHLIRREMALVVGEDHEGVRVQFQGDRVQGLFHVPKDKAEEFVVESLKAAAGLQTSLEIIKPKFNNTGSLDLAIGCDLGTTLASNLGERGHRDRICLGRAVETAAQREEDLDGGQTGISKEMYALLPAALKKIFIWDTEKGCYSAKNQTARGLDLLLNSDKSEDLATVQTTPQGTVVTPRPIGSTTPGRIVPVAASYAATTDAQKR